LFRALRHAVTGRGFVRLVGVIAVVLSICLVGVGAQPRPATIVENDGGRNLRLRATDGARTIAIRFGEVQGNFEAIYHQEHRMELDGVRLRNTLDFKAVPISPGGSLVLHKPRHFVEARVQVLGSHVRLGGAVTLIEPTLALKNPFRCDNLTFVVMRPC
jgi:hypothetical protein